MKFRTIVTLGPAILDEDRLKRIDSLGECIYRINGAHVDEKETLRLVEKTREILPDAKIMIDLPTNKIRTTNLFEPIRLVKDEAFTIHEHQVNYPLFHRHLKKGNVIYANDSIFSMEVLDIINGSIKLLSRSNGLLYSNKGLHVAGIHSDIPFLFEKDLKLIEAAQMAGIRYLSVSFVRSGDDVRQVKRLLRDDAIHLIAKIETKAALDNLDHILESVESVLIDRGDLSTEIEMIKLAAAQEMVVERCLRAKKDIYLATQFLKNMERNPVPLISEVIDLCRTVRSGIAGIQLSEETAVGRHPVECVRLVFDAVKDAFKD